MISSELVVSSLQFTQKIHGKKFHMFPDVFLTFLGHGGTPWIASSMKQNWDFP